LRRFLYCLPFTQTSELFLLPHEEFVKRYRHRYNNTSDAPGLKKDILSEIVAAIHEKGRFLKPEGDRWVVIPAEQALVKTARALQYRERVDRITAARQAMMQSSPVYNAPRASATQEALGRPDDLAATPVQKVLEMYCSWMIRANESFWQHVGSEVRSWLPDDVIAAVPLGASIRASPPPADWTERYMDG
jgi:hypothetical protein